MTKEQEVFLKELSNIQDFVVNVILSKKEEFDDTESMLNETIYETIYRCMELLDGYRNNNIKCEIKNINSGNVLNAGMELHNRCETFLKFTDI